MDENVKKEIEERVEKVRREGGIELMKASAGSGKTFSLAREYIRLLLMDKSELSVAHRGILAVTFTNKATGEMKERIIKELDKLAVNPKESDYKDYLLEKCGYADMNTLSSAASKALTGILNDYSSFSVMTIDKFFQRTLRAFAREIGMYNEYTVELDKESLVDETVDRLLDSLSDESEDSAPLLEWLSASSIESVGEGDGYHLDSILRTFAKSYLSPDHDAKLKKMSIDESDAFAQDNLNTLKSIANGIIDEYYKNLHNVLDKVDLFFQDYMDQLSLNFVRGLSKIRRFANKKVNKLEFSKTLENVCIDGKKAYLAKYAKMLSDFTISSIETLISKLKECCTGASFKEFNTARIIKRQLAMFRVADRLRNEFASLMAEKGVVCIDNTNEYIRRLVGDENDVPFVYEKLGVRFKHFLLDEFQDTSVIQWENFLPLLRESVGGGNYNLIVGDVKQSIYRWRDADWHIIDSLDRTGDSLPSQLRVAPNPLVSNFRSAENIIKFNNEFYKSVSQKLDGQLNLNDGRITSIYKDVEQIAGKSSAVKGSVEFTFCDKAVGKDVIEMSVEVVKEAIEKRGYSLKDIAVLVRSNIVGSKVALKLIEAGIAVVSGDSLVISGSTVVRRAVACLFKLDNENDKINSYEAKDVDVSKIRARSLYEMAELAIRETGKDKDKVNADTPYVVAFMDMVREFEARNGNSLHSFLRFWQEEGMTRCIASPKDSEAVTVVTIHKSKGLAFPFVVLPVGERDYIVTGKDNSWDTPETDGTSLSLAQPSLYYVPLSDSLNDTLFENHYKVEKQMLFIDNINVWYVATTRASQALHIVSPKPSADFINGQSSQIKGLSDALYGFANRSINDAGQTVSMQEVECEDAVRYLYGEIETMAVDKKEDPETSSSDLPKYRYYGDEELCDFRNGLKIKSDAGEFFDGNYRSSYEASDRVRGIVLHGILEKVVSPDDLQSAVRDALLSGLIDTEDADSAEKLLFAAIASVSAYGWFPEDASKVIAERDIVDENGECLRPDRVVLTDNGVDIIDYKFGDEAKIYINKVKRYASLYREMGYENVSPYIWYVREGKIEKIS